MNFELPFIPVRETKPREKGLTMMMDKGLSIREAENFCESSGDFTDLVKFGFGTAVFSKGIREKIRVYTSAGIQPYFGGTFFEIFYIRGMFDAFRHLVDDYQLEVAEISDGSIKIPVEDKLRHIEMLSKQVRVLSEVGSKVAGVELSDEKWLSSMDQELKAGAWKVIAEARESGTAGIFNSDCSANKGLIELIIEKIGPEKVLWEAPNKPQQAWFIKLLGADVNLGNIATNEVVALEALRLGLRGDTFFEFLPKQLHSFKQI